MNLQVHREKLHLTQEELSEKSGISVRTIQRIEAGASPKGHTLKALAKAMGLNEAELTGSGTVNNTILKLINLSSLPVAFLPFVTIIPPLLIMFIRKEFGPVAKQLVSVQIIWSVLAIIIFMTSAFIKNWFSLSNQFTLLIMVLLVLSNVFIIIRNAAEIDRKQRLYVKLPFSFL